MPGAADLLGHADVHNLGGIERAPVPDQDAYGAVGYLAFELRVSAPLAEAVSGLLYVGVASEG